MPLLELENPIELTIELLLEPELMRIPLPDFEVPLEFMRVLLELELM